MTLKAADEQKAYRRHSPAVLLSKTELGMVAQSFRNVSKVIKAPKVTTATTNRAMILPLSQLYVVPPHSRASRRETMLPVNMKRARMLSCLSLETTELSLIFWFFESLKSKIRIAIVNAPTGRLSQKLCRFQTY